MVRHQSVGGVVRMVRGVLPNPVGVAESENWLAQNSGRLAGNRIVHCLRLDRASVGWSVDSIAARVVGYRIFCNHLDRNAFVRIEYMAAICGPVRLGVQRPREVRADRTARRNTCL